VKNILYGVAVNKRKLLEKIYNNNKNVKFNEFITLVEAFGFVFTRSNGSHLIYKNFHINEWLNLQSRNGEAKPYQVKQFLEYIEIYNLQMEE